MQEQVVRWDAYDDDLNNNSIELSFIDGGQDYYLLADSLSNNGLNFITLPNVITTLGQFKVSATDNYETQTMIYLITICLLEQIT